MGGAEMDKYSGIQQYYFEKLKTAPIGFGVNETNAWLSEIDKTKSIQDIEPLLTAELSQHELSAFIAILNNKYINEGNISLCSESLCAPSSNELNTIISGNFEDFIKNYSFTNQFDAIHLFHDKSKILDFSQLSSLRRIDLIVPSNTEKIILPNNNSIEAIRIVKGFKLSEIQGIDDSDNLRYFTIKGSNRINNFDFIKGMDKLFYFGLCSNSKICDFSFLSSSTVILQLAESKAIKDPNIVNTLRNLNKLRRLSIASNTKERKMLEEQFSYLF